MAAQPESALTKKQACEYLGKSERSIVLYIRDNRLPVHYISGPNGREARFERADLDRLKADIETPLRRGGEVPAASNDTARIGSTGTEIVPVSGNAAALAALTTIGESLAKMVAAQAQPALPPPEPLVPWVTLEEAVRISGLTRAWLVKEARAGQGAIAIRDMGRGAKGGRWRFLREDLAKAE